MVVGAGLAGCEAAWQLARAGIDVELVEMKPQRRTPAQRSDGLAELVCSNSLRSTNPQNAVGLLKEEMRSLDSLIIAAANHARVPAGDALAVDRAAFSAFIEAALSRHDRVRLRSAEVTSLPGDPCILATGPLTADSLAADLARVGGRLFFHDALAPIVAADSLDHGRIFAASRYDKGGADYLNCPMDEGEYARFYAALVAADCLPFHDFEEPHYFEGCLPLEEVARRGEAALRFGCMKPVGLTDPRTGRRPYAVVQLRQEDRGGQAYNLVGFQTKLKHGDQVRVLRLIPGLENAEFLRLGAIHRNTYMDAPRALDASMRLLAAPHVRLAGQMTGVEGYVESAAHGLWVARQWAAELQGHPLPLPVATFALGALYGHVRGLHSASPAYEPQNVHWGLFQPLSGVPKRQRKQARLDHARAQFQAWLAACGWGVADAA
jgi:methylenetetrahydrofolate--tRNA-(uracil-5-)-methyltransferase